MHQLIEHYSYYSGWIHNFLRSFPKQKALTSGALPQTSMGSLQHPPYTLAGQEGCPLPVLSPGQLCPSTFSPPTPPTVHAGSDTAWYIHSLRRHIVTGAKKLTPPSPALHPALPPLLPATRVKYIWQAKLHPRPSHCQGHSG